jgi:hypothetical protein
MKYFSASYIYFNFYKFVVFQYHKKIRFICLYLLKYLTEGFISCDNLCPVHFNICRIKFIQTKLLIIWEKTTTNKTKVYILSKKLSDVS